MKKSARDLRAAYIAELHQKPPSLSLDLRKKYQVDNHKILWTAGENDSNIIEVRKGVNFALERTLSLSYKALVLHKERTEAASKARKAIESIVAQKSALFAVGPYELALGGQLWGSIPRFNRVKPGATEAYSKVQELVLAAELALKKFPPLAPDAVKNHDFFSSQFLMSLSGFWRTKLGRRPARSSEGPFIRFASDAWEDLRLKAIVQNGELAAETGSWLGSKWPSISRNLEEMQREIEAIFPDLKTGK
ncbi:MAG: hypothetical protein ACK4MV_09585 [Beijerinckiaceae bacterium]